MSEDIKKTISELHIYEKKLLKELEANREATPEQIAENANMDIKSVMSAAGSLASKDIIEVDKEVQETYSLTEDGLEYAEHGLPERKILDVLAEKREIHMKDIADEAGLDKKEANIAIGWLRRKSTKVLSTSLNSVRILQPKWELMKKFWIILKLMLTELNYSLTI